MMEYFDFEIDYTAAVLTLIGSAVMWGIIWFNPIWQESVAYDTTTKIILSVVLPIVAYPAVVYILNK